MVVGVAGFADIAIGGVLRDDAALGKTLKTFCTITVFEAIFFTQFLGRALVVARETSKARRGAGFGAIAAIRECITRAALTIAILGAWFAQFAFAFWEADRVIGDEAAIIILAAICVGLTGGEAIGCIDLEEGASGTLRTSRCAPLGLIEGIGLADLAGIAIGVLGAGFLERRTTECAITAFPCVDTQAICGAIGKLATR